MVTAFQVLVLLYMIFRVSSVKRSRAMMPLRVLTWPRFATLLLAAYWIMLAMATHVPTLPTGSVRYNDKIAHCAAYSVLAFLIAWAWRTRWRFFPQGVLVTFGVASLYGAIDELSQTLVPGRFGDYYDWLANVVGATMGILLFWAIEALWRLARRPGA
ncbi:MAG: VanZ family protein [Planctomycetota bacterium]